MEKDLKNLTLSELSELARLHKQPAYTAGYIFSFIHSKHAEDLAGITPLSKSFREELIREGYSISSLRCAERLKDPDGTIKYLFTLPDEICIESVRLQDQDRLTLCISSQAGCRMACSFCATGHLGFRRNLMAAEIVDQVYRIESADGPAQNIVYMGMGEPLDNFDEVIRSLYILHEPKGRNLGMRHITISTCGLSEPIRRLAGLDLQPRLAISLHAAEDQTRNRLMGISRREPLGKLMEAIGQYQKATGRRITFEYCMIDGVNDSDADAEKLLRLLKGIKYNVNLIELNEFPGCPFRASDGPRIKRFAQKLNEHGVETVIRFRRGRSICAACGQLGAKRLK